MIKNQSLYCREKERNVPAFFHMEVVDSRGETEKSLNIKHNISSERSERVRYCYCYENIKFISSRRHHVISSMYNEASLLIRT